jgi:hypothetical protein
MTMSFSPEMDYTKQAVRHRIWYDQAPNNQTEQNNPYVWLNLAIPMS